MIKSNNYQEMTTPPSSQQMHSQRSVIIEKLSQIIEEKKLEIQSVKSFEKVTSLNFFDDNEFYSRSEARNYIDETYGFDKKLIENRELSRGNHTLKLRCSFLQCCFRIECRRNLCTPFVLIESRSCLKHGIYDENSSFIGFCTAVKKMSTKSVLENSTFQSLKDSQSNKKNSKKSRLSNEGIKNVLSICNENNNVAADVTIDTIKKANGAVKISPFEHFSGFFKLIPYLKLYRSLNPGFVYKLETVPMTNDFLRVAMLFPYSVPASRHCFKVFGIDAAHLDTCEIKGKMQLHQIKQFFESWPDQCKSFILKKCFVFAVTGRTVNNEMILFAISICYSESIAEYEFLFQFLRDNEFDMNRSDITILSDRGTAILPALNSYFYLAFLKPCPLHIKRNLVHNKLATKILLSLYWAATNAPTVAEYDKYMAKMRMTAKGKLMAEYLEGIDNWQLFKAIQRGNIIYEMKSDNIVEITFAWLSEVRSFGSPYFVIGELMIENTNRINALYKECLRTSEYGLTERADNIYQSNNLKANYASFKVVVTDIFQRAGYLFRKDQHRLRTKKYNVNLTKRECDCQHYQQSGCPCEHAILLSRELKTPVKKEDFAGYCFVDHLQAMFESCCIIKLDGSYLNLFATVLPSEDSILEMLENNCKENELFPVLEVRDDNDKSLASAKRIPSQGDTKRIRNVSKRRTCKYCSKSLSTRTKHKAKACVKYYKKMNNGKSPLITPVI